MKRPQQRDIKRKQNPDYWFSNASSFRSAVLFILEDFKKPAGVYRISHASNAHTAVSYMAGMSVELYLKGYLVSNKINPDEWISSRKGHDLKWLRKKCRSFGDIRFDNENLCFLTDKIGKRIMELRYPETKPMATYNSIYEDVLALLRVIAREVQKIELS